jgi:hypothetical protein
MRYLTEEARLAHVTANAIWYQKPENKASVLAANKARAIALRDEVLDRYGRECTCCGELEPVFLEVHHINGDGKQHAAHYGVSRGNALWLAMRAAGWPNDGFELQVLCANCHTAITKTGTCPHVT